MIQAQVNYYNHGVLIRRLTGVSLVQGHPLRSSLNMHDIVLLLVMYEDESHAQAHCGSPQDGEHLHR